MLKVSLLCLFQLLLGDAFLDHLAELLGDGLIDLIDVLRIGDSEHQEHAQLVLRIGIEHAADPVRQSFLAAHANGQARRQRGFAENEVRQLQGGIFRIGVHHRESVARSENGVGLVRSVNRLPLARSGTDSLLDPLVRGGGFPIPKDVFND